MHAPRRIVLFAAVLLATLAACAPAPVGHRGAAPAEPAFALRAGDRMLSLDMARPYRPRAPRGGTDDYRCFLLDPGLTAPAFVTGIGFVPGNRDVVHHAILFAVPAAAVAEAKAEDAQTPGDGWTCFSGTGLSGGLGNTGWLAAWAPGGRPTTYPDGVGVPVGARSRIVLQVHYNLMAGDAPDRTGVRLRVSPARQGITPLATALFPAPVELACAASERGPLCRRDAAVADVMSRFGRDAGQIVAGLQAMCGGDPRHPRPGATQRCDQRIEKPMTVRAAAGHMHLLGRSIRLTLNPGTPRETVLLDVPNYDFDNQGATWLARPVAVAAGDTIRVSCTYDTALRARLPELSALPPRYVVWGEGTADEMCLGILTVTRASRP
jgi:hypothetical protein